MGCNRIRQKQVELPGGQSFTAPIPVRANACQADLAQSFHGQFSAGKLGGGLFDVVVVNGKPPRSHRFEKPVVQQTVYFPGNAATELMDGLVGVAVYQQERSLALEEPEFDELDGLVKGQRGQLHGEGDTAAQRGIGRVAQSPLEGILTDQDDGNQLFRLCLQIREGSKNMQGIGLEKVSLINDDYRAYPPLVKFKGDLLQLLEALGGIAGNGGAPQFPLRSGTAGWAWPRARAWARPSRCRRSRPSSR